MEFEKKRHEPVKYDRELWKKTVKAMKRVEEIKLKREAHFIMQRLKKGKELRKARDIKDVKDSLHLLKSPAATKAAKYEKKLVQVVHEEEDEDMEEA